MSTKFQVLIKTKIPTNKNANLCWHFNIYEQDKFCAQLSLSMKKCFTTSGLGLCYNEVCYKGNVLLICCRMVVRAVQMSIFPDEILLAQRKEKDDRLKQEVQDTNRMAPGYGAASPDSGFDNRGLDLKHDSVGHNNGDTVIPDVQIRNGKVRQRQLSNQSTNGTVTGTAETAT